ncbi:MAG TPA: VWA domain-containing protein [Gammaproteobacteria bacterium]|nr:VWA domain-containing protein [Gammaproteobacteria bacterium]
MGGVKGLNAFHFLHPAWLLALPVLWLLAVWLERRRKRSGAWSGLVDAHLLPLLRVGEDGQGRSPWPLVAGLWTLGVLALAGPAWQHEQTPAFRLPAAWMLVLDLSPSMDAADQPPDRVTRARYAVEDILSAARDARVGLIVFGHEAHTVAPLTTDVATIRALLQPLAPDIMPEPGDSLAPALDDAGKLLGAGTDRHAQVVVLTDGFADPAKTMLAAQRLHKQGTTVNVVGIGTAAGAPEPDGHGGFVRDAKGRSVLTRLQSDELKRVANAGGGRFVLLNQLPSLIATLHAGGSHSLSSGKAAARVEVQKWRNGGIWLLPPLLFLAALLARRGWL